jgi:ATP-binding cassette, subfamily B (MDR/TAP), member 1
VRNITSFLRGWTREHNAKAVQKLVYTAVTEKEMLWFDLQMGSDRMAMREQPMLKVPLVQVA